MSRSFLLLTIRIACKKKDTEKDKRLRELKKTTVQSTLAQTDMLSTSTVTETSLCGENHLCCGAGRIMISKTCVFSDSVLCLGGVSPEPVQAWKDKIKLYLETRYLKDLYRIDGESMEFEGTFFPGFTTLGILAEIQKIMAELKCEPVQFQGRIIFMSMYNDIFLENTRKCRKLCGEFFKRCSICQQVHPHGCWSFLGLDWEKKCYGTHVNKPNGEQSCWDHDAQTSLKAGILYFKPPALLGRGELKSKGGGKKTIHYNGSEETVELILRTVISVNKISICETVADLCNELDPDSINHLESEICESLVIPTESANASTTSQSSTSLTQGKLLQVYFKKFAELLDDQKLSKRCSDAGFLKEIKKGQFFITIKEGSEVMQDSMSRICEQHTHIYSTYRVAQHHISSREHGWLQSWKAQDSHIFHPRVMSHSLPHLTLTTSTSSLLPISYTSPIFPTVSPSQTSPMIFDQYTPCEVPRQSGGSTQIPALTVMSQSRSSLKASSPEELSLTAIMGQIRVKYRKDLWEVLLPKMWLNMAKFVLVYVRSRGLWIISNTNCTGETCCNVFIREQGTGKPSQEFCFHKRWSVKSGKISSWRQ